MGKNRHHYLFDGAFGTYYRTLTGSAESCEAANLTAPDLVRRIHCAYIAAGAEAIKVNSFAANRFVYDAVYSRDIIRAGFRIARETAEQSERRITVFADIGGIAGTGNEIEVSEEYIAIAETFVSCGATHFLFETLDSLETLLPALHYLRVAVPDAVIAVSFAALQDGYTALGQDYRELLARARQHGADIVGLNCVCGPSHMLNLLRNLGGEVRAHPFSVMPNLGYPTRVNGRLEYKHTDNPDYFAEKLAAMHQLGATVLGGCCGTTPAHIRALAAKLEAERETVFASPVAEEVHAPTVPSFSVSVSRLQKALMEGRFVTAVELDPPLDADASFLISSAARVKAAGADVVTLADAPLARARADSFLLAAKVLRETGIDVMPHLTCRDRNSIAVKGLLLGAGIEGVQNVLAITGDALGGVNASEDAGKKVFHFNSFQLISYLSSLNAALFRSRPYLIAGALNVNAAHFDAELNRMEKKMEMGATLFLTQGLFSVQSMENLIRAHETLAGRAYLLAGVLPLAGYRNAVFLNNEVSGITIPEDMMENLRDKTPEEARQIALAYAKRIIRTVRPHCEGVYLMTPLKKIDLVCELIQFIQGDESHVESQNR